MAVQKAKGGPRRLPQVGTPAAEEYFRAYSGLNRFFHWVLGMAASMDEMAKRAHETLLEVEDDSEKKSEMESTWKNRKGMLEKLTKIRQVLLEIVLVRHVENYLNYLSGLLFEIFRRRPETLRSSERVDLASVLRHDSLDSFVRAEAERRVEQLSYSSSGELATFFEERFGLELFQETERPLVLEAIETRNISVHNRCIVNERYCKRTGADESMIGNRKELFIGVLDEMIPIISAGVRSMDKAARKKLKLKGIRFGSLSD